MPNKYTKLTLSEDDIQSEAYKQHLGGGQEKWEARGAFQLFLLKKLGLRPSHSLLDAGCGPIRAGRYLIDYLDSNSYFGVDYNDDFIRVALRIVDEQDTLREKNPMLGCVKDFNFASFTAKTFDYVLAFSVLNHCAGAQQKEFFIQSAKVMNEGARIVLTHAAWFNAEALHDSGLQLTARLSCADNVATGLNMEDWGWAQSETIFPIIELGLRG